MRSDLDGLVAGLQGNQIFSGGAGLFAIGICAAAARHALRVGRTLFHRHCMLTLEVTNRDKSYDWLLKWLLQMHGARSNHVGVTTVISATDAGRVSADFQLIPSTGIHYFIYSGKLVWYERSRTEPSFNVENSRPFETIRLNMFGTNRSVLQQMLDESKELALGEIKGKTVVYTPDSAPGWRAFGPPRTPRPMSSIVFDEGVAERLVDDVRQFLDSKAWYLKRAVPYRRGYLLYGPPGCGKSSFITALAAEIGHSICSLSLSNTAFTDDRLYRYLALTPSNSIVLLEDIDVAVAGRDLSKTDPVRFEGMGSLSFSGLLNALDGVPATDGRILFMTTNHIDRLPPALIRPGRVDVKQHIGHCTRYQIGKMFERFYDPAGDSLMLTDSFVDKVSGLDKPISAAQLQACFLRFRDDPAGAVRHAAKIFSEGDLQ